MRVLVTRPEPECQASADRIRAAGHMADTAPMLTLTVTAPDTLPIDKATALAVTSPRVADILNAHRQSAALKKLPVFAVGDRSAAAMREAGWTSVASADGDVSDLADLIRAHHTDGPILYPAALDRVGNLEGRLAAGGLTCLPIEVYRMDKVKNLPATIAERLGDRVYDRVLIYSQRTGEAFRDAAMAAGLEDTLRDVRVFAISARAAVPLESVACVTTAPYPTENALLESALNICKPKVSES